MNATSFEKLFRQSVHMNKMAAIDYSPDFLLPNVYHYSRELSEQTDIGQFLCLLGGGNLNALSPFSFSFSAMGCGLLLQSGRQDFYREQSPVQAEFLPGTRLSIT